MHSRGVRSISTLSLCCFLLTSCMVGPDFHRPVSPPIKKYTETCLPKKTVATKNVGVAGRKQYFVLGHDVPGEWWYLFRSCAINELVQTGLANSATLAAAQATLRQAGDTLRAQVGALMYPNVSGFYNATRQEFSPAQFGGGASSNTFTLHNAAVNVTYTLDVFGGNRRQLAALAAQMNYQQYELEAAYLTLTSNIVTAAVTVAMYKAQIEATQELIRAEEQTLNITQKQLKLGGASGLSVYAQQTQLAQLRASLPPLEKSLAQTRHALSVLVGLSPDVPLPEVDLNKITLPKCLPVSLPSSLVSQRPDVRASEALLHQANEQVGVATANKYPQFPLTAQYGWLSDTPGNLFQSSSTVWSLGGQLTQPIFNGGSLEAQRKAAVQAYNVANAQYRQTVLQAFQNVADSLRAIEIDARALQAYRTAEESARATWLLNRKQLQLGGVSYLEVLNANVQYQQTRISRIQAQAARYTDTVALFQSLGGGWWNRCQKIKAVSLEGEMKP